jgi:2-methylisocitrate lyase-like PEP mutase family enzyme
VNSSSSRAELHRQLERGFVLAPGIYNAMFAKLVEEIGFSCAYMTGFGTAARYGCADVGLVTQSEMAANVRVICAATRLPVIADADTGYGNALNVTRTVRLWERSGAAALHIEDQVFPKKCGFMRGKQVISRDEAVAKVRAALDARNDGIVVIARTDALAVNGWDDVIARARAFVDAGADLVFVDGIRTRDDLTTYTNELVKAGLPCLYNGAFDPAEVERLGFKVQILAGVALAAVHNETTAAMKTLRDGAPEAARSLPEQLVRGQIVAPRVYDGLTALIAQHAGFGSCAVPIDGIAAQLGVDPALVGTAEAADNVRYIADAVSIAVIAEAPRGLGDALAIAHCVRAFEAAGAAGLYLDASADQRDAALDARRDPSFIIMAREGSTLQLVGEGHALSLRAVRDALARVRSRAQPAQRDQLRFDELTSLLGLDEVYALERRYAIDSTKAS